MPTLLSFSSQNWVLRACVLMLGFALMLDAKAQQASAPLPPQVVTNDPALTSTQAEADEAPDVTISPEGPSTSVRTYGTGGRPTREVVNPPLLPDYSESPQPDAQSVIPDSDPVRGDNIQPPMWTLWSW